MTEIEARTADGPLSVELTDRLIAELMSDEMYGYHHIMKTLPELAGEQGFSERSLAVLAKGLSGPLTQQYTPARSIAKTLSQVHSTDGLPEPAFSAVIRAVDHRAMLNRSAAIEVLATTRTEDHRYPEAMNGIVTALDHNDHYHTRSSAIGGLSRLAENRQLPSNVLAVLTETATSDPYMTVRMDAFELLATQNIDAARRGELSASLAAEIITPTQELWANSSGIREHEALKDRAVVVLADLYVPPYPEHVINAWIAQTRSYKSDMSLEALRQVYERNELSAGQIVELVQIGERHRRATEREKIYAMLFVGLQAGSLTDALTDFENAEDEASRIRAGYALKEQYRSKEVPGPVADVASRVAIRGSNPELRGIAAGLLSRTYLDRELREGQLIAALEKHPDDQEIHFALVGLYGPDRIDDLVIQYAADPDLSVTFRRHIIAELGKRSDEEAVLSPGAENALKEAARNADDYYLVQHAGDTLRAWGVRPPLRVAFKKRENQSRALLVILGCLVIVNVVAAIIFLISVLKIPLQAEARAKRIVVRTAMFGGWFLITAGMLATLAAAAIGFLGHNSLPAPSATLLWNTPAYLSTVVYVFLAWFVWQRARKVPVTVPGQSLPIG